MQGKAERDLFSSGRSAREKVSTTRRGSGSSRLLCSVD